MSYNIVEDNDIALDNHTGGIHEINKYLAKVEKERKKQNLDKTYKTEVKIIEGPWLYETEEFVFFFYDWHNKMIYGLKESKNMFKNGIMFFYYDADVREGNFHSGLLKFACYDENIYK